VWSELLLFIFAPSIHLTHSPNPFTQLIHPAHSCTAIHPTRPTNQNQNNKHQNIGRIYIYILYVLISLSLFFPAFQKETNLALVIWSVGTGCCWSCQWCSPFFFFLHLYNVQILCLIYYMMICINMYYPFLCMLSYVIYNI
jgi:hypothetical protein